MSPGKHNLKQPRRDMPHVTPRGRRLRFETCESRLLLAGNTVDSLEGGFLTVGAGGVIGSTANNFLSYDSGAITVGVVGVFDADAVNERFFFSGSLQDVLKGFQLSGDTIVLGDSLGFEVVNTSDQPTQLTPEVVAREAATAVNKGHVYGPFLAEARSDTSASGSVLGPTLPTDWNLGSDDLIVSEDPSDLVSDASDLDDFADKPAKLLEAAEPTVEGFVQLRTGEQAEVEGGAVDVSQVVAASRRDFQGKLAALVAKNLDRGEQVHLAEHHPMQPPSMELARAVAFETLPDAPVEVANGQEPLPIQAAEPEVTNIEALSPRYTVAQLRFTASEQHGRVLSEANAQQETLDSSEREILAERLEAEHESALPLVLADWPLVAASISGVLWADWRGRLRPSSVQKPPRRRS